jgi:hypothetical protein
VLKEKISFSASRVDKNNRCATQTSNDFDIDCMSSIYEQATVLVTQFMLFTHKIMIPPDVLSMIYLTFLDENGMLDEMVEIIKEEGEQNFEDVFAGKPYKKIEADVDKITNSFEDFQKEFLEKPEFAKFVYNVFIEKL